MEVVVGVEEKERSSVGVNVKTGSESASLNQVSDPVVYKLVRVDKDGKLVPATDDELREVVNLLDSEMSEVADDLETVRHDEDKGDSLANASSEKYRGASQSKIDEGGGENVKPHSKESFPTYASRSNRRLDQSQNGVEESSLQDASRKGGSAGSKPNFSLLKGDMNLDKLTIRELQETFRATFGRETSVKDKLWLKRRIAMGLTNSYDVSVTSFGINDGKFLDKLDDSDDIISCEDPTARGAFISGDAAPVNSGTHPEDGVEFRSFHTDSGCRSDVGLENRAAKRARKPTKRYIEELSVKETKDPTGKPISPSNHNVQAKSSSSTAVRSGWAHHSGALVTRPDSIGGSGVQVPSVSQIRRCHPRQTVMTLTKVESSDVALPRKIAESADTKNKPQVDTRYRAKLVDIRPVPFEDPIASEDSKEKASIISMSDCSQDREPNDLDSGGYSSHDNTTGASSDDNIAVVPTSKGGVKRKHHRAWSLAEVVKLVDGVTKFGAGRWSEIKRLSFSSNSHRSAVDLKDKWRNLLKASFSNFPAEKGGNSRKGTPAPIPTPIILKVRELAELNGQAPQVSRVGRDNKDSSVNDN